MGTHQGWPGTHIYPDLAIIDHVGRTSEQRPTLSKRSSACRFNEAFFWPDLSKLYGMAKVTTTLTRVQHGTPRSGCRWSKVIRQGFPRFRPV